MKPQQKANLANSFDGKSLNDISLTTGTDTREGEVAFDPLELANVFL